MLFGINRKGRIGLHCCQTKCNYLGFYHRMLKPYFESTTGIALQNGIKILVRCSIEFHEVYGMSLYINDIEPSYTVGDLALRRAKIIEQLRSEGILK